MTARTLILAAVAASLVAVVPASAAKASGLCNLGGLYVPKYCRPR